MTTEIIETPDYNTEYKTFKRCIKCQRKTEGIEQYQSTSKTGKIRQCKTCNNCRGSVAVSLLKIREPTLKEKIEVLKKFIMLNEPSQIKENLNKIDDNDKAIILKILS